jgi:hypothetical protein
LKKVYKKPKIRIEIFAFVQTATGSCGENLDLTGATQGSRETCGWEIAPGFEVFISTEVCDFPSYGSEDNACYDNPAGGYNIFSS